MMLVVMMMMMMMMMMMLRNLSQVTSHNPTGTIMEPREEPSHSL